MTDWTLTDFVRESNRIEGILREPAAYELSAHETLLGLSEITVADLEMFVEQVAAASLRRSVGMNVRVGNHVPPLGGPGIVTRLEDILADVHTGAPAAYDIHQRYEHLHPFTDGNGRSGRALWLWMMGGEAPLGFLHQWYYDSLGARR